MDKVCSLCVFPRIIKLANPLHPPPQKKNANIWIFKALAIGYVSPRLLGCLNCTRVTSWHRLSFQPRPRGDTLGKSSFKISSCARAHVHIIYGKTKGTLSWEYHEVCKLKTNHTRCFHLKPKLHQVSSLESGMGACHGNNLSFFHQEIVGSVATCQTWDAVKYLRRLSALRWGGNPNPNL